MNKILDKLFLGDVSSSTNKYNLKRNNVSHILTVAAGLYPRYKDQFQYKVISIWDSPEANLKVHF